MDSIRNYVDNMFSGYPEDENNMSLKEEIIGNMEDKYDYFISSGSSKYEALGRVVSEFGSITELEEEMTKYNICEEEKGIEYEENLIEYNNFMKFFPYMIAGPILLLILAVGSFVLVKDRVGENFAILSFFVVIGIGVMGLIVAGMKKANYERILGTNDSEIIEDDSEEFSSIDSFIWLVATGIFLLVGFLYDSWKIAWIVFIFAAAVQSFIEAIEDKHNK